MTEIDETVELARMHKLPGADLRPTHPLQAVLAITTDAPQEFSTRLVSLISTVFRFLEQHPIDYESEPDDVLSIDKAYWETALPQWFLAATPFEDDVTVTIDDDNWTVEGWLYWFLSPHEERNWRWHSLTVKDGRVNLQLEVEDYIFLWGALNWAIRAADGTAELVSVVESYMEN